MSINITMPALSPTMEEGKLAKWHVKEGDTVSSGDVIAEIETDKATMEVEAVDEGKIGQIVVPEGTEGVKVNAVIATILQEGETAGAKPAPTPAEAKAEAPQPAPQRKDESPTAGAAATGSAAASASPSPVRGESGASAPGEAASNGQRTFASPLARRMATEAGIDITAISGSGPHGRVVKSDVENASTGKAPLKPAASPASKAPAAAAASAPATFAPGMTGAQVRALYPEGSYRDVPNDGMRKVVAARLTESKQSIPHYYITIDIRADRMIAARQELSDAAPKDKEGRAAWRLSLNDFIVKAWAMALQKVPDANATWAGDSILYHQHSDVAVAVAVPGGLFTPVIKAAETKTLRQISDAVRDLATRARSKKLAPHEYQGGTSSVSNLGMYGVKEFTAVINPPHATILSVGTSEERVFVENGEMKIGSFITAVCGCDHRAVDGALGAQLMQAFKQYAENPTMMLL